MGYHIVNPSNVEPLPNRPSEARPICGATTDAPRFDHLGIRVYRPEPGEQIPSNYHYHDTQEEAFYVLDGTMHVETPEREYVVEQGTFFLVEGGNPHRAFNPADAAGPIQVIAMGAPTDDKGHHYEPR